MQTPKNKNADEFEGMMAPVPVGLHYFQELMTNVIHHFYISGDIGPAANYVEMIHAIRKASQGDVIYIHLNSTGGQLDTGIQIINAMRESQAHIVCSIEAQAYSMASLIFLSADEFVVHENSILMIHNFSGGMMGKGNEQRLRLDAMSTLFDSFSQPLYVPFITPEEFEGVIDGKDMWFHSDEIKERLANSLEIKQQELEKIAAEMEQEESKPPKRPRKRKVKQEG